jgi:hypothetical protein
MTSNHQVGGSSPSGRTNFFLRFFSVAVIRLSLDLH